MMSRRKQAKPRALKREMDDVMDNPESTISTLIDDTKDQFGEATISDIDLDELSPVPIDNQGLCLEMNNDSDKPDNSKEMESGPLADGSIAVEEYRCETCDTIFISLTEFMDHRNFECTADREIASELGGLSPDSRESSSDSTDQTSTPTASDTSLNHGCQHTYGCQFCEKRFSRKSFMKHHEQVHTDQMPYKCELCKRFFKHKRSRDRHVKLHTGDKKYKCQQCDSAFSRSDHLRIHQKTHETDALFHCEMCSDSFNTNTDLASHMLIHSRILSNSQVINLECAKCGEKFDVGGNMELHMQMHNAEHMDVAFPSSTREQALPCPYCGEICIGKDSLEVHFNHAHVSEKFKCPACNAGYPTLDDLLTHLRTQHDYPSEERDMTKIIISPVKMVNMKSDDLKIDPELGVLL
jgi:DNA-directed RNA polymerase subunit RPC12/RpoP